MLKYVPLRFLAQVMLGSAPSFQAEALQSMPASLDFTHKGHRQFRIQASHMYPSATEYSSEHKGPGSRRFLVGLQFYFGSHAPESSRSFASKSYGKNGSVYGGRARSISWKSRKYGTLPDMRIS